jgi:histidinol dehydrogenase
MLTFLDLADTPYRGPADRTKLRSILPRPSLGEEVPSKSVEEILRMVRTGGDDALMNLTASLDHVDLRALGMSIQVDPKDINSAREQIDEELWESLQVAAAQIEDYHRFGLATESTYERNGVLVTERSVPVDSAGIYVPGGKAVYPSSVLMTAIPAKVAGVRELVICTPPRPDGSVPPLVLAAASLCGIETVCRVGGAQAIAALAWGTQSIPQVDVIAGPGNLWVAEAKRQVSGMVGVAAAFAGPSEVVVIVDERAGKDPELARLAALDVMVQAEHGPNGLSWLVSWDRSALTAVKETLLELLAQADRKEEIAQTLGRNGYAVLVADPQSALEVSNAVAPEHLELLVEDAHSLARHVHDAGAVFLGDLSTAAFGDYVAGPSHVLPTNGTARFASVLGTRDFQRSIHFIEVTSNALFRLGHAAATIARTEGLTTHEAAITRRAQGLDADQENGADQGNEADDRGPRPRGVALSQGYHSPQVATRVRLNTNEAPWPPPSTLLEELAHFVKELPANRYPDREASELREALGSYHEVPKEKVFCASGANEVLQTLFLAYGGPGRRVAIWEPTYALHSHIAKLTSTHVLLQERGPDFALDASQVSSALRQLQPDLAMFCSPNNPTGALENPAAIEAALEALPNGLVVVDEAYVAFAKRSFLSSLSHHANLVLVRTFSKQWAMAGLRLGYLLAHEEVVQACQHTALPYHLGSLQQQAGILAIAHAAEMAEWSSFIATERRRVSDRLVELGCVVHPSDANFVLFRAPQLDAHELWAALVERSVLIRELSAWPSLRGHLRVTIGTPEENDSFLAAMQELLAGSKAATARATGLKPRERNVEDE